MMIQQLALVSEAAGISTADLLPVGAAVQKQAMRDLGPLWDIQATVDCFASLGQVPLGYWPIIIRDGLEGSGGIHEDNVGKPLALVPAVPNWSLIVSHEAMEMLVDPSGRRTAASASLMPGQGRVDFLVEVCDSCQAVGYSVDGIAVSDFITPNYFDQFANSAVRYSFTGSIKAPREILKGGYLSWHDPVSDHWFQGSFFGTKQRIFDIGPLPPALGMNIRALMYAKTPKAIIERKLDKQAMRKFRSHRAAVTVAGESRAASLRKQIAEIISRKN